MKNKPFISAPDFPKPSGNTMIKELDIVKIKKTGQTGTIVCDYDGNAFEIEVVSKKGKTILLKTFSKDELEIIKKL